MTNAERNYAKNRDCFRAPRWPCSCLTEENSETALTTPIGALGVSIEKAIFDEPFKHPAGRRFRQSQQRTGLRQRQLQSRHFLEFTSDPGQ